MAVGEAEPVCVDGLEVGLGELDDFGGGEWLVWGRFGSVGEQCVSILTRPWGRVQRTLEAGES